MWTIAGRVRPLMVVCAMWAATGRAEPDVEVDVAIYGGTGAAVMAAREGVAVQDVPYDRLRERLMADGQRLEPGPPR